MARQMPKFTKAPEALVSHFARLVEGLKGVETRKMFGYPAAFVGGQMFAYVFGSRMILRLDEANREAFSRLGATPFEPMPGRVSTKYLAVPEGLSDAEIRNWFERARAHGASLPPKEKRKPKKREAAKKQGRTPR
jgi:TfoX/Sxy family transcriptional regulator of competence genes